MVQKYNADYNGPTGCSRKAEAANENDKGSGQRKKQQKEQMAKVKFKQVANSIKTGSKSNEQTRWAKQMKMATDQMDCRIERVHQERTYHQRRQLQTWQGHCIRRCPWAPYSIGLKWGKSNQQHDQPLQNRVQPSVQEALKFNLIWNFQSIITTALYITMRIMVIVMIRVTVTVMISIMVIIQKSNAKITMTIIMMIITILIILIIIMTIIAIMIAIITTITPLYVCNKTSFRKYNSYFSISIQTTEFRRSLLHTPNNIMILKQSYGHLPVMHALAPLRVLMLRPGFDVLATTTA